MKQFKRMGVLQEINNKQAITNKESRVKSQKTNGIHSFSMVLHGMHRLIMRAWLSVVKYIFKLYLQECYTFVLDG